MVYCTACGTKNEEGVKTCASCGRAISYSSMPWEKEVNKQREMCFGEKDRTHDNISTSSFGIFIALLGIMIISTPNIISEVRSFFEDWRQVNVGKNVQFAFPSSNHPVLYNALAQFCIFFGIAQIGLLFVEFIQKLSIQRKAGTVREAVLWLGAGSLFYMLSSKSMGLFQFGAMLIILIGVSLILRSVFVAISPKTISTSTEKTST